MNQVKDQYNNYVYPQPITDMKEAIANDGYIDFSDANLFWEKFFPEKKHSDKLKVFVAGCGTNQIIYLSLKNPNWELYGIDISENSIDFVKEQIKKYEIKNIKVDVKDIMDTDFVDEFDLVISSGVIHHTVDPKKTLTKLVKATKLDGAIYIMVYGKYQRSGVYDLQKVFNYLGIQQNEEGINFIKEYLNNVIPSYHMGKIYFNNQTDKYDSGIIDTFLNYKDVAYYATDIEELLKGTGAFFQNWYDSLFFYPDVYFNGVEIDLKKISDLTIYEQADLTQRHLIQASKLDFILRKNKSLEFIWHNISDLNDETRVKNSFFLGVAEKVNWKKEFGGQLYYKNHGGIRSIAFNLKEGVVWQSIIKGIEEEKNGLKIGDIHIKCNIIANEKNLNINLEKKELMEILHKMWKLSLVEFSKGY
tara:strand:- start:1375 stop:2628 length:1254 start_codon:yes stop_codon:yes gene_type:complete